jgi:hypothetical protein
LENFWQEASGGGAAGGFGAAWAAGSAPADAASGAASGSPGAEVPAAQAYTQGPKREAAAGDGSNADGVGPVHGDAGAVAREKGSAVRRARASKAKSKTGSIASKAVSSRQPLLRPCAAAAEPADGPAANATAVAHAAASEGDGVSMALEPGREEVGPETRSEDKAVGEGAAEHARERIPGGEAAGGGLQGL